MLESKYMNKTTANLRTVQGRVLPAALMFLAFFASIASAQRPPDIKLDPVSNREVVEGVIRAINKYYVSAEMAKQLESGLRDHLRRGEYDHVTSAFDLVDLLDEHMQQISKDAHLKLGYSHKPGPPVGSEPEISPDTPQKLEEERKGARDNNFGFEKVERLPGNIGYLALGSFERPVFSGEMTGTAMSFLANTDALIIDLRSSRGGSADMVVFLASYFFDGAEPFRLGDWYTRAENGIQQCWTYPYLPGARYLDKDVYILVSRRSFSAVEGFTSIMQHHKKAVVVGEPTRGGTHPGSFIRVHPNFAVFVPLSWFIYPTGSPTYPIGRPVFPSGKTDYQGTGIKPDIPAPSAQALKTAQIAALEKRIAKHADLKDELQPIINALKSEVTAPRQ